ncbi:MAG: flavodoxin domain-containing protein [Actinomycetota bacterium]|nr:flavodoxin domain-containing protein [Actinomycetota bacterium]
MTQAPPALSQVHDLAEIRQRITRSHTDELLVAAERAIAAELREHGIAFESRQLPVSLTPTLVPADEVAVAARAGGVLRAVLNRAIAQFIDEHRRNVLDGPLHRFFTPYYKWWNLIASERREQDHIQLMRYDAVRTDTGRWSFIETNTACPGGTIHCARVRTAWLNSVAGQAAAPASIDEFAVDDETGFVRFMAERAQAVDPDEPNIAILNYQGDYTNELESLRRCHEQLRARGELPAGRLLIGDIRDLRQVDGESWLDGAKIALIYNKLDQLRIDPEDPEVAGWVAAARSERVEFLNSLGALYLTEAKRSLALLSDPDWNQYLRLTADEARAVAEFVPYTRLLEDLIQDGETGDSLPGRARQSFVLKADSLTRGSGIFIGGKCADDEWLRALASTRTQHGVAQLMCDLPCRDSRLVAPDGQVLPVREYFGVDVFFFGASFAGLVGRSHTSQVFNVGNGGRETPALVIGAADV